MDPAAGGDAGVWLESLTWRQAEQWLTPERLVVLPLGAEAKQHGPHLPLNNDATTARWLAREVCRRLPVVVAPLINAHYYPAFVEYPGSISLRASTARDLLVDICRSLAAFGVRRFYVLNTGVSTVGPLARRRNSSPNTVWRCAFSACRRPAPVCPKGCSRRRTAATPMSAKPR